MLSPASIRCLLRSTGHALRRAGRLIQPALTSAALCLMTACTHESGLPIEKTTLPTDPDRAAWEAWQSAQAASRAGMQPEPDRLPARRTGAPARPPRHRPTHQPTHQPRHQPHQPHQPRQTRHPPPPGTRG